MGAGGWLRRATAAPVRGACGFRGRSRIAASIGFGSARLRLRSERGAIFCDVERPLRVSRGRAFSASVGRAHLRRGQQRVFEFGGNTSSGEITTLADSGHAPKLRANAAGSRMQPCEAGCPGTTPNAWRCRTR